METIVKYFRRPRPTDPLDESLLWLDDRHPWTWRDLNSHLLIQGVTGSGKTFTAAKVNV